MYTEVLEGQGIKQTPEFTSRVLSYEIGDIHKILIYIERFGNAGYIGDLKLAHADLLTMVNLLGEQLGYDLKEQEGVGLERFLHRMVEVSEYNKDTK